MKSALICTITLALLALSMAEKTGPYNCDKEFVHKYCTEDNDEIAKKRSSTLPEKCQKTYEALIPQMKSNITKACAKKDDLDITCSALIDIFDTVRDKIDEACFSKGGNGE